MPCQHVKYVQVGMLNWKSWNTPLALLWLWLCGCSQCMQSVGHLWDCDVSLHSAAYISQCDYFCRDLQLVSILVVILKAYYKLSNEVNVFRVEMTIKFPWQPHTAVLCLTFPAYGNELYSRTRVRAWFKTCQLINRNAPFHLSCPYSMKQRGLKAVYPANPLCWYSDEDIDLFWFFLELSSPSFWNRQVKQYSLCQPSNLSSVSPVSKMVNGKW